MTVMPCDKPLVVIVTGANMANHQFLELLRSGIRQ